MIPQKESDNMNKEGKPGMVPNVAWWKVGKEALAITEWPGGDMIDVHNIKDLGHYVFSDDNFGQDWNQKHMPSHEQYEDYHDPDGKIWSAIALEKQEGDIVQTKRAIYTLDPRTKRREIISEWNYTDANLTKCDGKKIFIKLYLYL